MKIVILDGYAENPGDLSWDGFAALGDLTVYDRTPADQIISRIGDAEIILTNKTPGTAAVAQHVFALLLELCHHAGHHNAAVQQGRWTSCPDFCFWDRPLTELAGKTMGIVGYGRIGRSVSGIAQAFGMKVLACSAHGGEGTVSLQEVLTQSDVISLHCPLTADNAGMINREAIARMKNGVFIINTARGPLIDETALREALLSGKVRGAAVDVVSTEPIPAGHPLLGLPNCIITPHIAWAPRESRQRLMDVAVENLRSFLMGTPVNNVAE